MYDVVASAETWTALARSGDLDARTPVAVRTEPHMQVSEFRENVYRVVNNWKIILQGVWLTEIANNNQ